MRNDEECDDARDVSGLGQAAFWCSLGDPPYLGFVVVQLPDVVMSVAATSFSLDAAKQLESATAVAKSVIGRL